jgi:plastocyanin
MDGMRSMAQQSAPKWMQHSKTIQTPKFLWLLGALLLGLGAAACGGGGYSTSPGGGGGGAGGGGGGGCPAATFCTTVSTFTPTTRTVAVGTTVTWENNSGVGHTVFWDDATGRAAATAGDGSGDMTTLNNGASHTRVFNTAGTYGFHCTIHPGMSGTLTVQ